jgi:dipeptidyl aminopeptidase/acylaminoacyl peptidase
MTIRHRRPTTAGLFATAALLGLVFHADGGAQAKRALTIADVVGAARISEPTLSPDGRLVAFVHTTIDRDSGKRNADVYVVPADGSAAPLLVAGGPSTQNSPRFLPDSKRLAYLSGTDDSAQVFTVGVDGREPKQLTKLKLGVQTPLVVSPDGRLIAFVSDTFRDCKDEACNGRRADAEEHATVKVRRLTDLMFRHWDEWRDTKRHHVFVATVDGGEPRDVTPGDFDAPPHNYEDASIAFSRDSRQLAFVSKRDGRDVEAWSTNMDVWLTSVSGGELRKITPNLAADQTPLFSTDGRSLIARSQRRAGFESDRWYLDVYDLMTGAKRTVFTTPDLSVDEMALSPDGASIWFTVPEQGRENLYSVPFTGGAPKRVATGGVIGSVSAGNGFIVATRSTMTSPAELVRIAGDGTTTPLTHEHAAWLRDVTIPAPESLTVPGAGGATVQYWLLKPPNFDPSRKYATVFLIHGGPQGNWDDGWGTRWNPALWAAQGWVIAAPNPRGSTGFGQRFVDEISQDWGGKVMADLDAVFAAVTAMPFVDSNHLGIAGASYGGYAVNWIIGHTNRFKAAVSHDGVFNLESMAFATEELWFPEWEFGGPPWSAAARANFAKWSPHLSVDKVKTPTLIITNERDFRVPVDQGLQMLNALRRNGVPAEALVFPDEGHFVLKPLNAMRWLDAMFEWMRRYL